MYTTASPEFVKVQSNSGGIPMTKVQILDQNETIINEIVDEVEDGSVKVDMTADDCRRSFSLTIDNSHGLFQVSWPNGIWLHNRVKIWTGFVTSAGIEYVPQGVFVLRSPSQSSMPGEAKITLQGSDKASLLNGDPAGELEDTVIIQVGTNVAVAQQTLSKMGGVTNFNYAQCSYTVPYTISGQPGDSLWKIKKKLALSIGWEIFFDRNGFEVFRPVPDYTTLAPATTLSISQAGANMYIGTKRTIDDSGDNADNVIVAIGGSSQTATVRAVAEDSSTQSATSTTTLNQRRVRTIRDSLIDTVAKAQARANYELQNSVIGAEKDEITVVSNFLLDEQDVITLNDPTAGLNNKNIVIVSMDVPLKYDKEMTIEAWEARNVIAQNNLNYLNQ